VDKIKEALTYDDVLLVPQYSEIESRQTIDIGNELGDTMLLDLPIISSPMDTVTEGAMASTLAFNGGLGIIHRYNTIEEQCDEAVHVGVTPRLVGAAVGVTGDYFERAQRLVQSGVQIICIDVAHGHHFLVERAIKSIRDALGRSIHIMAGNVATAEGYVALSNWGADSVRCNVGGGSICSTRIQTGFGVPGLHTIFECDKVHTGAKIIADGGIKTSGDIVKALAAGADFVMLGSLLSGTNEAPGEVLKSASGKRYKTYRGMASKAAQQDWKGNYSSNEGVSAVVPAKGPVLEILKDLKNGIASGFSYAGARNLSELQKNAQFIRQTSAGKVESSAHILQK